MDERSGKRVRASQGQNPACWEKVCATESDPTNWDGGFAYVSLPLSSPDVVARRESDRCHHGEP